MKPLNNSTLRSLFAGIRSFYMGYFRNYRKEMGYCDPTATVSRPMLIQNPKNVFLYENTKIVDDVIMAANTKFIMKKGAGSAEGLNVITGSHERRIGRFYRSIIESEKKRD